MSKVECALRYLEDVVTFYLGFIFLDVFAKM